jgi:flagellar biosynthesis/type III secretory pathway chaperone
MTDALGLAERLVDEILPVLDREIDLLDLRREQLAELLRATLARDEASLSNLLENIEKALENQAQTDRDLASLRSRLAEVLDRPVEEIRLAAIADSMSEPRGSLIRDRRGRIIELTEALRTQHVRTTLVVSECAKLNRRLLEGLFPQAKGLTTYGARGGSRWDSGAGLVDVES